VEGRVGQGAAASTLFQEQYGTVCSSLVYTMKLHCWTVHKTVCRWSTACD